MAPLAVNRSVVYVKTGVRFDRIAPAGMRILSAVEHAARECQRSLTITCGTEAHGPNDPHTKGEAYDVRSRKIPVHEKRHVLQAIMAWLREDEDDAPVETAGGLATRHFFGFLEQPGTPHEHLHIQRRRGTVYP